MSSFLHPLEDCPYRRPYAHIDRTVYHSSDVLYWLGYATLPEFNMTVADRDLSRRMMRYL